MYQLGAATPGLGCSNCYRLLDGKSALYLFPPSSRESAGPRWSKDPPPPPAPLQQRPTYSCGCVQLGSRPVGCASRGFHCSGVAPGARSRADAHPLRRCPTRRARQSHPKPQCPRTCGLAAASSSSPRSPLAARRECRSSSALRRQSHQPPRTISIQVGTRLHCSCVWGPGPRRGATSGPGDTGGAGACGCAAPRQAALVPAPRRSSRLPVATHSLPCASSGTQTARQAPQTRQQRARSGASTRGSNRSCCARQRAAGTTRAKPRSGGSAGLAAAAGSHADQDADAGVYQAAHRAGDAAVQLWLTVSIACLMVPGFFCRRGVASSAKLHSPEPTLRCMRSRALHGRDHMRMDSNSQAPCVSERRASNPRGARAQLRTLPKLKNTVICAHPRPRFRLHRWSTPCAAKSCGARRRLLMTWQRATATSTLLTRCVYVWREGRICVMSVGLGCSDALHRANLTPALVPCSHTGCVVQHRQPPDPGTEADHLL